MSRTYSFRTLDVFTNKAYAGNQLAIITIPATQPLTRSEKQSIAIEFNYSETIFIHEPTSTDKSELPHVKVDIFTPVSELPFAGHPTIGALNHIFTHIYPDLDEVIVDLKAGPVLGKFDRQMGYASASIPQEFHRHAKSLGWDRVVENQPLLNEPGSKLETSSHALVSIVRGMNFGLVDLTSSPELLKKVEVVPGSIATKGDLDDGWEATLMGSLYFVRKPDQNDGVVRVDQRVIVIGLEDPATGAASAAFTAHLAVEMGGKGAVHKFELVQGEQMGRRSIIGVEVTLDEAGTKVDKVVLLGQCKAVMKGELEI